METPEETDLLEHLQSLKDLPGGFGLAFADGHEIGATDSCASDRLNFIRM